MKSKQYDIPCLRPPEVSNPSNVPFGPVRLAHAAALTAAVLLSVASFGCGGEEGGTVPVSGVVRFEGQPLPGVTVRFHPERGRMAFGKTDAQGQFQLTTSALNDGAMPGSYAVTVIEVEEMPTAQEGQAGYQAYAEPTSEPPFPLKYTRPNETTLSAEVTVDGENEFQFDLEG